MHWRRGLGGLGCIWVWSCPSFLQISSNFFNFFKNTPSKIFKFLQISSNLCTKKSSNFFKFLQISPQKIFKFLQISSNFFKNEFFKKLIFPLIYSIHNTNQIFKFLQISSNFFKFKSSKIFKFLQTSSNINLQKSSKIFGGNLKKFEENSSDPHVGIVVLGVWGVGWQGNDGVAPQGGAYHCKMRELPSW